MTRRIPFLLPPKRKPARSGIAHAPQRIWLRHRKFVRSHHCIVPGCDALDIQVCHIRSAANAGTGLKPHDAHSFPACHNHHAEQHQVGQGTFEDRHGLDLEAIAAELVRRSPDVQMRLALALAEEQGPCSSAVEQRTRNAQAVGSIPTAGSIFRLTGARGFVS